MIYSKVCNLGIDIVIEHNNICNLHELESLTRPFRPPRRPAEPSYRAASQSRAFFIIETPYHFTLSNSMLQQVSFDSCIPVLGCCGLAVVLVLLPTLGLHFLLPNQGALVVIQDSV